MYTYTFYIILGLGWDVFSWLPTFRILKFTALQRTSPDVPPPEIFGLISGFFLESSRLKTKVPNEKNLQKKMQLKESEPNPTNIQRSWGQMSKFVSLPYLATQNLNLAVDSPMEVQQLLRVLVQRTAGFCRTFNVWKWKTGPVFHTRD